jgi:hypothetical protein
VPYVGLPAADVTFGAGESPRAGAANIKTHAAHFMIAPPAP